MSRLDGRDETMTLEEKRNTFNCGYIQGWQRYYKM
jgi:hypothetical protein